MHFLKWFAAPALVGALLWTTSLIAQPAEKIWDTAERLPERRAFPAERIEPGKLRAARLNTAALRQLLRRAPQEVVGKRLQAGEEISLPMPDGSFARFRFVESSIMEPELAAKFPEIKTYAGEGIDDPSATIRFDLSPRGFHAQILSPKGAVYIDPASDEDAEVHLSYYKRDYKRAADDFKCLVEHDAGLAKAAAEPVLVNRSGTVLRTYRLACAATGEYTQNRGGTVSSALAAIVTAINRINQIYEAEISVRLVLVANNDQVIYTNGATDPYTNNDGFAMLTQNISTLNSVIGSSNYDIGHVFSTGGGGVAYLGSVCTSSKGGGVTGSPSPVGDPFYVDYVAHEMGHQFGANHTFNSTASSCGGGNRNSSTAYEPGSGSTIMAYAGICSSDNLQNNSDPYFHSASFDEIMAFLAGTGGNCASTSSTGNTVPTVNAGPNYTIPRSTPFTLTATGSDANGDTVTYCWEQRDLGAEQTLSASDNGASPLFRSFNPTTSPSRTFPRLINLLSNTTSPGEKLPTLGRTMKFRVTARDNRVGGGGVNTSDMQVVVDGNSGPFVVTSPNTSVTWSNVQTVTWNVAGTASSPVNCSMVNILLSTNGGNTFPITLIANTPNDGSESVVLPSLATSQARIKVEAVGNIFFDISNVNFSLVEYVGGAAIVGVDSLALIGESCTPTNNAIDPGEMVTVRLGLKNFGQQNATNVTAQLLEDAGVVSPSVVQSFGTLTMGGAAVTRDYSFIANGTCGGSLPVRFAIRTNGVLSSIYTNTFVLGGLDMITQSRTNATYINLPDGNASPYPSSISVSGLTGTVEKVTVTLTGLSHTWPADLDMVLVGPQGQKVLLLSDAGGSTTIDGVNVTFDDDATSNVPASGGIPSGTYKPTDYDGNDSDPFPSGPSGPFSPALAAFKDTLPNGTWSLYIRDQYANDTGFISGGWRMSITTKTLACCVGNTYPPVLAAIANRTIHVGSTLVITNSATDLDTPSSSFSYELVTAPLGASIGSNSGILTWTPAENQLGSHSFSVRVNDNGVPNLNDTKGFTVNVVARPLQSVSLAGNQFTLQWSAVSGRSYQIQMKTDLNQGAWTNVTVVTASGATASFVETTTSQQKYFRIIALD